MNSEVKNSIKLATDLTSISEVVRKSTVKKAFVDLQVVDVLNTLRGTFSTLTDSLTIGDVTSRLKAMFQSLTDSLFWFPGSTDISQRYLSNRSPPMDIADLGDKYEMQLEIPGIPKEDINIEVTPNGIEISAEYEDTNEDKGKNWLRRERTCSSYYRSYELPEELKTDDIEAELEDGILKISLPKVEPRPRFEHKKVKIK